MAEVVCHLLVLVQLLLEGVDLTLDGLLLRADLLLALDLRGGVLGRLLVSLRGIGRSLLLLRLFDLLDWLLLLLVSLRLGGLSVILFLSLVLLVSELLSGGLLAVLLRSNLGRLEGGVGGILLRLVGLLFGFSRILDGLLGALLIVGSRCLLLLRLLYLLFVARLLELLLWCRTLGGIGSMVLDNHRNSDIARLVGDRQSGVVRLLGCLDRDRLGMVLDGHR